MERLLVLGCPGAGNSTPDGFGALLENRPGALHRLRVPRDYAAFLSELERRK